MTYPGRILRWLNGQAYLLLGLTALAWGGNTVAGRLAVGRVSPMAVVSLRWLIVLVVLLILTRASVGSEWRRLLPRWRFILLMGGLGYTAFNAIFYWAAHHTTAINMGVVQGVTPAMVMLFAFLIHRTPIRAMQAIGLAVTLVGVAVATSRGEIDVLLTLAFNVGDLGIALASALYAGYTVGLRDRPAAAPLAFFSAMAASAFLTSLPLLAAEVALGTVIWPGPSGWAIILYIALIPSLLAQLGYMRGVELIGGSRAGLFMNLVPILGPIMAVLLLGESFALYHALALVLVLGGIWLAERAGGRAAAAAGPPERSGP
ncbi:DMT family transporter [Enterovirga sp.]|uniref:DMT family transporter n=1 Tax=Enterovirga sp. TaxID=2026350 RepID=UPI002638DDBC|nr:DMT family transporter [Enterovirga sp.]MDB5591334.1 EamA family transporter [Enterovirga sp.]